MTDDELTALLKAMEDRLVGRLTTLENEMKNLGSKTDVAREVSFRVPRLVVEALEAGLLPRLTGIEAAIATIDARLTAIEARLP